MGAGSIHDEPFLPRRLPGRRRLLLLALTTALPGCARLPWGADGAGSLPVKPELSRGLTESWRALGKIAVRAGDERWSASFDWRQSAGRFRLRLSTPFGNGAFQVTGGPGGVELTTAAGERRSARTAEALFAEQLGWELPASSLRHWITGRARPGDPVQDWTLDELGRLVTLRQHGWSIEYKYRRNARRPDSIEDFLPERLMLRGEGVTGRLVVREWRLETRV